MAQDAKIEFVFLGGGADPTAGRAGAAPRDERRKPLKNNPRADAQEQARIAGGKPSGGSGEKGDEAREKKKNALRLSSPLAAVRGLRGALLASAPAVAAFAVDRLLSGRIEAIAAISPEVALARAQNEVASLHQNMEFARRSGGDLAEFERLRGAVGRVNRTIFNRLAGKIAGLFNREPEEGGESFLELLADPNATAFFPEGTINFGGIFLNPVAQALLRELDRPAPRFELFPLPEPLLPNDGPFAEGGGQRGTLELSPGLQLQ